MQRHKDKGIWKNSTSADSTFDALTELVDTYVPVLLNQPNIKKALEEKLGMTVTDTTSISDLIMGVSPTLLNLLSSPMNKADIIDGYRKGYSDVAYAYLDEKDAKMSFYQLFSFCCQQHFVQRRRTGQMVRGHAERSVRPAGAVPRETG